jgi:hypothetical protein
MNDNSKQIYESSWVQPVKMVNSEPASVIAILMPDAVAKDQSANEIPVLQDSDTAENKLPANEVPNLPPSVMVSGHSANEMPGFLPTRTVDGQPANEVPCVFGLPAKEIPILISNAHMKDQPTNDGPVLQAGTTVNELPLPLSGVPMLRPCATVKAHHTSKIPICSQAIVNNQLSNEIKFVKPAVSVSSQPANVALSCIPVIKKYCQTASEIPILLPDARMSNQKTGETVLAQSSVTIPVLNDQPVNVVPDLSSPCSGKGLSSKEIPVLLPMSGVKDMPTDEAPSKLPCLKKAKQKLIIESPVRIPVPMINGLPATEMPVPLPSSRKAKHQSAIESPVRMPAPLINGQPATEMPVPLPSSRKAKHQPAIESPVRMPAPLINGLPATEMPVPLPSSRKTKHQPTIESPVRIPAPLINGLPATEMPVPLPSSRKAKHQPTIESPVRMPAPLINGLPANEMPVPLCSSRKAKHPPTIESPVRMPAPLTNGQPANEMPVPLLSSKKG